MICGWNHFSSRASFQKDSSRATVTKNRWDLSSYPEAEDQTSAQNGD
jgi:hypothetical protein